MIGNRKIIALCISEVHEMTSYEFTVTLNDKISKLGYTLFVYNTCSELGVNNTAVFGQSFVFELMDFDVIDAVVVFDEKIKNGNVTNSIINRAKAHGKPVAVIGETRADCTNLSFDDAYGYEMLARHVVDVHDFSTIHFLAGDKGNFYSEERIKALKSVLKNSRVDFDESMISYCGFCSRSAEAAVNRLIAEKNIPDIIMCANDVMAIAATAVLIKHGIKVPDDVIVTGYDGISEIEFISPRITSVKCSYSALAEKLAKLLPDVIEGKLKNKTFFITPELILSESCGCAVPDAINAAEYMNMLNNRFNRYQQEAVELAEISAKVQICENFAQISALMNDKLIYDVCCILNKDCADEKINPLDFDRSKSLIGEDALLIYDNDGTIPFLPRKFNSKDIIPHLDYFMDRNRIFIFTPLNYFDSPMGYVCFHFSISSYENFLKIPQIVNMLNNGIGGYRNIKYKNYLLNKIDEMYRTDFLTGLLNRRSFSLEYKKLINNNRNTGLTVVLADLDGLKYINDTFGHEDGDIAIRTTAQALMAACPSDALCVRFGGDEMIAVCIGELDTVKLKENFNGFFTDFNAHSNKPYKVSASIGAYYYESVDGLSIDELISRPDYLMYLEKKKGNC